MNNVERYREVDRRISDSPDSSAPLTAALADFGTYEERERVAIRWGESLSPEDGDAVLRQALAEWDELAEPAFQIPGRGPVPDDQPRGAASLPQPLPAAGIG